MLHIMLVVLLSTDNGIIKTSMEYYASRYSQDLWGVFEKEKKKQKKKDQNISGIGLDHECLSASKVFHETCIG